MAGCQNDYGKLIGRNAVLEVVEGCPDTVPQEADWKILGAMTTKSFDLSPNTVTSEADDTKGFVEGLVTSVDFTISGDGEWRKRDKPGDFGPAYMTRYYLQETKAGRQPSVWIRLSFATITITAYMNTTAWSGEFGTGDIATFSAEFKVADADSVTVTDDGDIALTGIAVTPNSLGLKVGESGTFSVNFLPANATNKNFTLATAAPAIATASAAASTVTVTAVAEGATTVTVTSDDGKLTSSCAVTVTSE
ncbi:Ig-like domain-containing protein [Escherichia marmotae]|uniref:phage tail tube protein n=1 Tax=Escherichia marmotae TaxID=1499973 RepID=UPI00176DCBEC|nr:Ig-like domain-containing protein [Escherichia marmotae]HAI8714158.1 DNA breaking-rejoining protein [Escherichia coli]MEC9626130.1 Ig-like domain-containing protein [Escherichia marmotae]MED0363728.1 Ig-like domain-containing protein [Escherichia marmotae]MED8777099.1 Ig-like domain-containing protein [Escherichia marmotae]MED9200611.1 Ig-like domain-containing protein [Escherichia marmotae]